MFIQSNEIETHDLISSDNSLVIYIVKDPTYTRAPWQVQVYRDNHLVKIYEGYLSPEGARHKANEFVKDTNAIFGITWGLRTKNKSNIIADEKLQAYYGI